MCGSFENRIRFLLEIIRRVRGSFGDEIILTYRLSMLDLVEGDSTWEEVVTLAKEVEKLVTNIITTGVGWHEACLSTIASGAPSATFPENILHRITHHMNNAQLNLCLRGFEMIRFNYISIDISINLKLSFNFF